MARPSKSSASPNASAAARVKRKPATEHATRQQRESARGALPRKKIADRAAQKGVRHSVERNAPDDFLTLRKGAKAMVPVELERETPYPIKNKSNNVLVGVLHEPKRAGDTLVIAVHGFTSSKNSVNIKQVCIELARAGCAAYRFDLSGNGDSEGRFEDATPRKMLNDIHAVIEHFHPRYRHIILFGRSMGGYLSILVASAQQVGGVITWAAPMHWDTRFADRFSAQQREQLQSVGFTTITQKTPYGEFPLTMRDIFVKEAAELHPLEAARHITCPVLVMHGTADTSVPLSESEELFAALPKKDLFVIGGADHRTSNPEHLDAMIARIIEWLRLRG